MFTYRQSIRRHDNMIDLYYWPTPNGRKISIMLEECALEYTTVAVDIGSGDQFDPDFLKISPNNRMPAIVDHDTGTSIFEGGAILLYLAEKAGRLLPTSPAERYDVLQWLFWQAGGLGPIAGQLSHFVSYVKEPVPYAQERFANEYDRLLAVMDVRLRDREFLAGDYSIADIASFPWLIPYRRLGNDLDRFPNLRRWFDTIKQRPAVRRGTDLGKDWQRNERSSAAARSIIFGQNSTTVYAAVDGKNQE
jgi:GST-like protein